MRRPRVLLDLGDYPVDRDSAQGIGLRFSELADALSHECQVLVFAPGAVDPLPLGAAELVTERARWDTALRTGGIAVFTDLADESRLERTAAMGLRVVTENAPPIEHLEYPSLLAGPDPARAHRDIVRTYVLQLQLSHHFLCRSAVEKVSLVASLCAHNRLSPADIATSRTLDHLISLVPIGFSETSAAAARRTEPARLADFLWTGGIWSFYQPELLVEAVAVCRDRGIDTTAAFLYADPEPDNRALVEDLRLRIDKLDLADRVLMRRGPLSEDQRGGYLKGARALVALGRPGVENETCLRLRIRDSRLYGTPLIVDAHGATGVEVALTGTGVAVADPSPETVADAMASYLATPFQPATPDDRYRYQRTLDGFLAWARQVAD